MERRIKVFIVENDVGSIESLRSMLHTFPQLEVLGFGSDVHESVRQIQDLKPDLLFLDIELNGGTGFDLLSHLRDYDFDIIFTTAFEGFAIDAIKLSALDYLLKPFGIQDIQVALEKLFNRNRSKSLIENLVENNVQSNKTEGKIALFSAEGIHYISLDHILYCKADSNYTYFFTENETPIIVSQPLKKYQTILEPFCFFRIHQSYLINLTKVKKFKKCDGGFVQMNNGKELPISRRRKELLLDALRDLVVS